MSTSSEHQNLAPHTWLPWDSSHVVMSQHHLQRQPATHPPVGALLFEKQDPRAHEAFEPEQLSEVQVSLLLPLKMHARHSAATHRRRRTLRRRKYWFSFSVRDLRSELHVPLRTRGGGRGIGKLGQTCISTDILEPVPGPGVDLICPAAGYISVSDMDCMVWYLSYLYSCYLHRLAIPRDVMNRKRYEIQSLHISKQLRLAEEFYCLPLTIILTCLEVQPATWDDSTRVNKLQARKASNFQLSDVPGTRASSRPEDRDSPRSGTESFGIPPSMSHSVCPIGETEDGLSSRRNMISLIGKTKTNGSTETIRRTQHTGATKLQAKHHPSDRQTTAHQATTTQRSKEKQGGDQASFSQDNAKGNRRSSRVPVLLSSPRKKFWKETVQPLRGRCHVLVRLRPHGFEDTKNPWQAKCGARQPERMAIDSETFGKRAGDENRTVYVKRIGFKILSMIADCLATDCRFIFDDCFFYHAPVSDPLSDSERLLHPKLCLYGELKEFRTITGTNGLMVLPRGKCFMVRYDLQYLSIHQQTLMELTASATWHILHQITKAQEQLLLIYLGIQMTLF
ncbi:uncharacterized protein CLUP02_11734 [Colletotrichum lupini]|uniref:Uncharacterized protein n=1 Tax=Colletotrichum lupini TaxID=145971 RepID=A0A9Q8SZ22_9PEZI|nr:uncharacterized protein CLUP02_11734 [Colletotrichum lupini]UQC86234.1 hypothetical protein CLUP02_11734 [Colletotrichum lupini]